MARTREQHEAAIVKVIEKEKECKTIFHIFDFYPGLKISQFYNLKLEKSEAILKALWYNRQTKATHKIDKMLDSDNPTLVIAGLRMLLDPDQREALNTVTKVDAKVSTPDSGIAIKFLKDDSDKPE